MNLFLASSLDKTMSLFVEKISKIPNQVNKNAVLFIANAADLDSSDDKWWIESDRKAFTDNGFSVIDIDLRKISSKDLEEKMDSARIIHFCGGSVFYLQSLLQYEQRGEAITKAVREGRIVYTGTSAGSIVPTLSTEIYKFDPEEKKFVDRVKDFSGLGLVNFVILPHCNSPEFVEANKVVVEHAAEYSAPLLLLQDSQAVWIEDGKMEVVESFSY